MSDDKPYFSHFVKALETAEKIIGREFPNGQAIADIRNALAAFRAPPAVEHAQDAPNRAILSLITEVEGLWDAFEYGLRAEISNTNYAVVREKLDAAREALRPASSSPAAVEPAQCDSVSEHHTPLPWAATTRQGSWDWVIYSTKDPNIEICQLFHDGTEDNETGEANADLIVKAVNSFGLAPAPSEFDIALMKERDQLRAELTTAHQLMADLRDGACPAPASRTPAGRERPNGIVNRLRENGTLLDEAAAGEIERLQAELAAEKEESASYHRFWIEEREKRRQAEAQVERVTALLDAQPYMNSELTVAQIRAALTSTEAGAP